jgi:hypothetical protein
LLEKMLINLSKKRVEVKTPCGDRPHGIVGLPLGVDPVAGPRRITA